MYGYCFEKIEINYDREYYSLENIRITIDKNISYKYIGENHFSNNLPIFDKSLVLEIKSEIGINLNYLNNLLPLPSLDFQSMKTIHLLSES